MTKEEYSNKWTTYKLHVQSLGRTCYYGVDCITQKTLSCCRVTWNWILSNFISYILAKE